MGRISFGLPGFEARPPLGPRLVDPRPLGREPRLEPRSGM
jgi:hypothetical protein